MAMEMALRSSISARLSLPPPPSPTSSTSKASVFRPHLRPISVSLLPISTATTSLLAFFSPPHDAKALTLAKDQIITSLTEVEKTIDQVQEASSSVMETTTRTFGYVSNALKPSIDVTLPVLRVAIDLALSITALAIAEASKKAQEAIESTGIDTQPVFGAAKKVADVAMQTVEIAKPIASSAVDTISSTEPIVIVETAGAVFLAYLLVPPLWFSLSFKLRGYQGELTPAQVLDLVSTKNYYLIDIRSENDKERNGVPRVPSSAKNKMFAVPLEELPSNLRGLVRNAKRLEAQVAALKISYVRKIHKGSNIIIMDSYADSAKTVARALTHIGYKKCWIVAGGFSGHRGWVQSKLGTDSYNTSFLEVLSPSKILPEAAKLLDTANAKLLPGSD